MIEHEYTYFEMFLNKQLIFITHTHKNAHKHSEFQPGLLTPRKLIYRYFVADEGRREKKERKPKKKKKTYCKHRIPTNR